MGETLELSFPFVEELPKREKTRWEKFRDMWAAAKDKGPLVPLTLAAKLSDVSPQRMHELVAKGKLERVELAGHVFVTESSMVAWLNSPDEKGGRPRKALTDKTSKEIWQASRQWAKELVSPKK